MQSQRRFPTQESIIFEDDTPKHVDKPIKINIKNTKEVKNDAKNENLDL